LFRLSSFASWSSAAWNNRSPPELLPKSQEQDGVQQCLAQIIGNRSSDEILVQVTAYLWFIWKARNDLRFRKRSWSVLQVHLAVNTHIQSFSRFQVKELRQNIQLEKTSDDNLDEPHRGRLHSHHLSPSYTSTDSPNEIRCYTHASIDPGVSQNSPKKAGLGIFLQDQATNCSHYIKIQMDNITSVLMAEAAALAFAAEIAPKLDFQQVSFNTDNQLLVNCLKGANHSSSASWDSKPYTQKFINFSHGIRSQILKIPRSRNSIAHALARSVNNASLNNSKIEFECKNPEHVDCCPLKLALDNVSWDCVPFIAASCC